MDDSALLSTLTEVSNGIGRLEAGMNVITKRLDKTDLEVEETKELNQKQELIIENHTTQIDEVNGIINKVRNYAVGIVAAAGLGTAGLSKLCQAVWSFFKK